MAVTVEMVRASVTRTEVRDQICALLEGVWSQLSDGQRADVLASAPGIKPADLGNRRVTVSPEQIADLIADLHRLDEEVDALPPADRQELYSLLRAELVRRGVNPAERGL